MVAGAFSAPTAGCGKAPTSIKAGINTMTVNNKRREWILSLPDNYDNTKPYRFIFGLHWLTGTMNDVANGGQIQPYYGLPAFTNGSAIYVSPNGLVDQMGSGWANQGNEDIDFLTKIMETTNNELCIEDNLRFSMGFSYGAGMSHSLACSLGGKLRAVAAFSGALLSGCANGDAPVAFYGQHGNNDNVLPIASGRQIRDTWVQRNGCAAQSPEEPARGSRKHILTKYTGCKEDKPLWWTAFDGGHSPIPTDSGTSKDTTFTAEYVWEFFSQFK
ncbi:carbohydrate esterase family 1 protein [Aaosphaeria arxii CBS 175.79]|uniref:Feruloyl esterase C n=1 Tax=Aaosphaeria arxii CBS 175.79 TaxID=1450172 RepID=A0A6A5XAS4_9PLEO|nr:carbohydrate esterase family 1 protein [Aaosphaeria arxii CBS 175.79]KAF2009887.1 carbohydrate esterase family 1 protein [Aaosphaeria arxii CBS 175.79]